MKKTKLFAVLIGFSLLVSSCSMAIDYFMNKKDNKTKEEIGIQLDYLAWNKTNINLTVGGMQNLLLNAKPEDKRSDAVIKYEYDENFIKLIADSRGVIIEGKKNGNTILTAKNGKLTTNCYIEISGFAEGYEQEPYIYSNSNILQLQPGTQERVSVSLYGGSAEDSQQFKWISEKPGVVEVIGNGQFAIIKAKQEGNSKITITHPKAKYPYTLLAYSLADTENATYITTKENVLTLKKDKGEKNISVVMQNAPDGFNMSLYKWELIEKDGVNVCSLDGNADKAVVRPLHAGTAMIRVTHPSAAYPLEILVRVVEIVENVYIEPSETYLEIDGAETKNITVELKNYKDSYDTSAFVWTIPNNEIIDSLIYGNQIAINGKKNGLVKITVTHPKAEYPRDIMVKVKNQKEDAINTSMYITTNQNYIRTKVGDIQIPLNILLAGGTAGDQNNFKWTIKHNPKVVGNKVIKFETTHGEVFTRSIHDNYEDGLGYITPLNEGTAIIEITHPKVIYPTEVLVKVLSEYAVLAEPLYFTGDSLIKIINGQEKEVSCFLMGTNKSNDDDDLIKWTTESTNINIIGNGTKAIVRATGNSSAISYIKVSHPKSEHDKVITVLTANTQEELDAMKVLYSYKQNYKIKVDETQSLYADIQGFTDEEIKKFTWETTTPNLIEVSNYTDGETGETIYSMCNIQGKKSGEATVILKSNVPGVNNLIFNILVLPKNADTSVQPEEAYLTTFQNVVSFTDINETADLTVSAVGLNSYKYSNITWEIENDTGVVSIASNGSKATVTSVKEGEAKIIVSHPESQNKLAIYARVGKKFIYKKDKTVFISTNVDTLHMVKDEQAKKITAQLVNSENTEPFTFEIDNDEIAELTISTSNTCFVKPKKAGQALMTVNHPNSKFEKKILVLVANSKEELEGLKYLSTANNVIRIAKGQSQNVSVTIMNSKETIIDGFNWTSEDPEIATANGVGATAVIHGNEVGTTKIKVSNKACQYPLELIVICIDPAFATLAPFISTTTNVLTLKAEKTAGSWTTFLATLEGGTDFDQQNFNWQVEDSSIVQMFGQGNSCKMRAIKSGTTRLIITHPKATHPCYVLLICDEEKESKYFISVPENIITLKPNSQERAITASLVNGSLEDKYAFTWYADTYDVIELNYSANVASIRPIGQGQTTIHVKHPKAAYEQQIIVKVTEFTEFEFGMNYYKVFEGQTGFVNMRVPITTVPSHVEYSTLNDKVCMIQGTSKVAQITGIKAGNTKVKAKLIATKTNVVQAETELLVNVEPATTDLIYITSDKTIHTIEKNTSRTLTASITGAGITVLDQQQLQWKSSNPDVVKVIGASTTGIATGNQCMLQALKAGECTVTVSHEKSDSDLVMKIIVPGSEEIDIRLDKTYLRLETGSQSEVKATLMNARIEDYKTIEWSIEKQNEIEIATILGTGQTVALFARNEGRSVLKARLPNGRFAECEVIVEASRNLKFTTNEVTVQPGQTKIIKYSIAPQDASVDWMVSTNEYFTHNIDSDAKTITITGIKEGRAKITGVSQYGNKATLMVKCSWDYNFSINKSVIKSEPVYDTDNPDKFVISYNINPEDSDIEIILTENTSDFVNWTLDKTKKQIILEPKTEGKGKLSIVAKNHRDGGKIVGTRECYLDLLYSNIKLQPKVIEQDGRFSRYDENFDKIILGDGEKIVMDIKADKENANFNISNIIFKPTSNDETKNIEINNLGNKLELKHKKDKIIKYYKITKEPKLFIKFLDGTMKEIKDIKLTDTKGRPDGYASSNNKGYTCWKGDRLDIIYYKDKNFNITSSISGYKFDTNLNKTILYGEFDISRSDGKELNTLYNGFDYSYSENFEKNGKHGDKIFPDIFKNKGRIYEIVPKELDEISPYYISENDYKNNLYYCYPNTQIDLIGLGGNWRHSVLVVRRYISSYPYIKHELINNLDSISKELFIGTIEIHYTRNKQTKKKTIPVFYEERGVNKNAVDTIQGIIKNK